MAWWIKEFCCPRDKQPPSLRADTPYWTQDVGCSVRDSSTSATVEGDEGAELPGGQTLSSVLPGVLVIHGDIRCVCVPVQQGVKVGVGRRSCYCTKIGCMAIAKNCKQQ